MGETLRLVGNHVDLGKWDPKNVTDMVWAPGDTWTTEIELPVGKETLFKVC
jgi:hypothetical protein